MAEQNIPSPNNGLPYIYSFEAVHSEEAVYPTGVDPTTFEFLAAASESGAFDRLSASQRNMVEIYYLTDASLTGIDTMSQRQRAHALLNSAMKLLWQSVPPDIQQRFILEPIRILKGPDDPEVKARLAAAVALRQLRSDRMRRRWEDPEFRAKMIEKRREKWEDPAYRRKVAEGQAIVRSDPEYQSRVNEGLRRAWQDPALKQRMSKIRKRQWEDPARRQKKSDEMKAQWENPAYRQAKSESTRRQWQNPEHREHMSQYKPPPFRGPMSSEARQKISMAHKGRPKSPEVRAKISSSMRGKPSPLRGRKLSAEQRAKVSETQKKVWAKRRAQATPPTA